MGSTQIPADSPWLELGTASPTTGTVVSFTSLPEYKNYRIEWFGLTQGGGTTGDIGIRFNGDSGSNYAIESGSRHFTSTTSIPFHPAAYQLQMDIQQANELSKKITGFSGESNVGIFDAMWNNQSKINQISVTLLGTATFTGGTIKIFGRS
jgi:hypothetical protein